MIVSGVGLACVKEGKGIDINMMAFGLYLPFRSVHIEANALLRLLAYADVCYHIEANALLRLVSFISSSLKASYTSSFPPRVLH